MKKMYVKTHFPGKEMTHDGSTHLLEVKEVLGKRASTKNGNILTLKLADGSERNYLEKFVITKKIQRDKDARV